MMIRENASDLSQPKTIKVTVPLRMHLQLHQLKILAGTNISETVEAALDAYFEQYREKEDPGQGSEG